MSDRHGDRIEHFDLDEWVESVEGVTISLEDPNGLGPRTHGFRERPTTLCGRCEEMVQLVNPDGRVALYCPLCGRQVGALERGTQSVEEWRSFPEEEKNV